jgi:hypothetical protein
MSRRGLCVVLLGAALSSCRDTPAGPDAEGSMVLGPGLTAYVEVERDRAPVGATVRITVNLTVVGDEVTPTAFLATLRYDPDDLEPVAVADLRDGVERAVNLRARPGRIRAAGAAANGMGTETLFTVALRVTGADYAASLALDMEELIILEQDFANLAGRVTVVPTPLPEGGVVLEGR